MSGVSNLFSGLGSSFGSTIMPALQTAIGIGATVAGAPQLGIPLATQGASQLAGGGTGSSALNMYAPGTGGTPGPAAIGPALQQAGLTGIGPSQVTGVSGQAAPAAQSGFQQAMSGLNQAAPATQALMKAMGIGGGQGQQQQPQAQIPQAPAPMQRGQMQMPQAAPAGPTAAGQMAQPQGAGANPQLRQLLAMMGVG